MPALLDKRLIFVTGKGGVGKSTVAVTLGLVAAHHGLRTAVAELSGQARAQRMFGIEPRQFEEVALDERLYTISIDPQQAMEEYLHVKVGALGTVLSSSRLFQAFAMATPGMRELLSIGKVWELAQLDRRTAGADAYDLVIVDAPATGHGVALLRTPRTFAEIAKVGPIAHQGRAIAATIADRRFTGVLAVCTPEEMPVNETVSLAQSLADDGLALDAVVLNALYPDRFAAGDAVELGGALERARAQLTRSAIRAALSEHARAGTQRTQRARLADQLGVELIELPYVFADHLGAGELEQLADALDQQLHSVGTPA